MSIVPKFEVFNIIGIRQVWEARYNREPSYYNLVNHLDTSESTYNSLELNERNFYLQCINCVMISIISLQSQIFSSYGYKKFVEQ